MSFLALFFHFMKFGALCFGGGFMVIPLLNQAFVIEHAFFTPTEFGNLLSLSQMLPGAVSINSAAYIGFSTNGLLGAVFASLGLITPSIILAIPILTLFRKYKETWCVRGFLKGARLAAFVMILYAIGLFFNMSVISHSESTTLFLKNTEINPIEAFICLTAFLLFYKRSLSMIKILILAGLIGGGIYFLKSEFSNSLHTPIMFHSDSFDPDLCVNGKSGAWSGACACYDLKYSGRYCNLIAKKSCDLENRCEASDWCSFNDTEETGICFPKTAYPVVHTKNGIFILSDSIMNARSADSFCTSLGKNWRTATRKDFDCSHVGPACVNTSILTALKKQYGSRGFFWLDPVLNSQNNYYADINDGTVYITRSHNKTTLQALCIFQEKK